MSVTLQGLRVLVTRPAPSGETLSAEINASGGHAIFFPTISFAPAQDTELFQQQISDLEQYDWMIFISPQAVYSSSGPVQTIWPKWPEKVKIAAVGSGTAAALEGANLKVSVIPTDEWSSEGLLALPEFMDVAGKKIAIMCGAEGRDILVDTLTERGATVVPCVAYRRCVPNVKVKDTVILVQTEQVDAVVCASGTGLTNLKNLLTLAWPQLRKIPLVVISERLRILAKDLGFKKILLAKNASHAAIVTTLGTELVNQRMQKTPRISMPVEDVTEVSGEAQSESRGSLAKATTFLFTLLAIGALGTGLYYAYCQLINGGSKLANVTADLNNKIAQDQSAISTLQKAVQDNQQTSEQLIAQLHANQQSQDQWRVSEAQYLTSLANDNLQLGDNVGLVVTLLQNADQKLRDLSDPRIATIRRALANDIVAMQAVAAVDVTGIYLQLSALNDQVDKLVLPVSRPEATPAEAEDADKRMSWWRRGLRQSWEALSKVIVVRYNQGGERPFIPPDQQAFLTQNLHAMFEQALSATVHRQTTIYRTSLGQAQTWIKKYYLADSSVTQAMLTNLNQLQNQTLRPALPELTASLQAFHDYFAATETAAS